MELLDLPTLTSPWESVREDLAEQTSSIRSPPTSHPHPHHPPPIIHLLSQFYRRHFSIKNFVAVTKTIRVNYAFLQTSSLRMETSGGLLLLSFVAINSFDGQKTQVFTIGTVLMIFTYLYKKPLYRSILIRWQP